MNKTTTKIDSKEYYTKKDLFEMFDIKKYAFNSWREKGLKTITIGRKIIIRKKDLETFLINQGRYQWGK